jgi:HPt (histidine-containing phosphotransfer) domain-containing protein
LELRRLAHALKGAIASISAVGLGKTVADIHDKLRTTTEVTEADMQRLRDCYAHTQEDLHSWLTQNAVH